MPPFTVMYFVFLSRQYKFINLYRIIFREISLSLYIYTYIYTRSTFYTIFFPYENLKEKNELKKIFNFLKIINCKLNDKYYVDKYNEILFLVNFKSTFE